jgi:hypothetical protein
MTLCLCGSKAICAAVGENHREILRLVREAGLPAWKRGGRGLWRALPADLAAWLLTQRDRNLGREP